VIGYLRGEVATRGADHCFIDVGGVGYRLTCSATTLRALPADGKQAKVWTYTHVREDALALFGFSTEAEQRTFEALLTVPGVGPKVALQVCSTFAPDQFRRVLVTGDAAGIASVPGIGRKTAQRILIDLKEKLDLPDLEVAGSAPDPMNKARSALENLGYSSTEIREALAEMDAAEDASVEDVVRKALKVLA
jgi:Holliday junction DNA helicase RuvA